VEKISFLVLIDSISLIIEIMKSNAPAIYNE
jgi:hypothetical protein